MDWLIQNGAKIDCKNHEVTLDGPTGEKVICTRGLIGSVRCMQLKMLDSIPIVLEEEY